MISIGNSIALLALLGWPLVIVAMFRIFSIERALIWSILGAYMFLPQLSSIDLPVIPALNKETIPNLMAFAMCMATLGKRPDLIPESWPGRIVLTMFIISPAVTVLNNTDPVFFGRDQFGTLTIVDTNALESWGLPGMRPYDSASALAQQIFLMLPFFLARTILRTEAAIREILFALLIAAALYALPMLFEVRMSPQLHTRVYGFFQHDFIQAMRAGGFRPFVFMPHGLWVAFFAFMCVMAAAAWLRMAPRGDKLRWVFVLIGCFGLVVLCKSLGPIMFTVVFVPVVLFFTVRLQLAIAALLAFLVIGYPILRGAGLVPTTAILAKINSFNPDRAQSLEYRLTNEERILNHTAERPFFGWGGWGRFMVYDQETGRSETVVDGQWAIVIGHYGWLGYLGMFGLLALPIWSLWWHGRKATAPPVPVAVTALTLVLAVNMVDLLPNATLIPFTWLIAGALLGYSEELAKATERARVERLRKRHTPIALGVVQDVPDRGRPLGGARLGSARLGGGAPGPTSGRRTIL